MSGHFSEQPRGAVASSEDVTAARDCSLLVAWRASLLVFFVLDGAISLRTTYKAYSSSVLRNQLKWRPDVRGRARD